MPKKTKVSGKSRHGPHKAKDITKKKSGPHPAAQHPKSPFMHYLEARKPEVDKANPSMKHIDIIQIITSEWHDMDEKRRQPFADMAKKEKEEYERLLHAAKALEQKAEQGKKPADGEVKSSKSQDDAAAAASAAKRVRKDGEEPKKKSTGKKESEKKAHPRAASGSAKTTRTQIPSDLPTCKDHAEPLKYWCKACSEWICEFCVTKHSGEGHGCMHLLDYAKENLQTELGALESQVRASSGVSKSAGESLDKIVHGCQTLSKELAGRVKTLEEVIASVAEARKKYDAATQGAMARVEEMKAEFPELIRTKGLAKLYTYLKRAETMKKTVRTDDEDLKRLEKVNEQLEAYVVEAAKPVNKILESTQEVVKHLNAISDI